MTVLSILKDDKGTTLGVKVFDCGKIFTVSKSTLARYHNTVKFDNVIVDKNGYVRSKKGNLPVEIIGNQNTNIVKPKILYHGSEKGITFPIDVNHSINLCDFGQGFYLSDNVKQAENRVCNTPNSVVYEMSLNLTGLSVYEFTDDILWALFIAVNRNKLNISKYKKLQRLVNSINSSDVIIGLIADDKIARSYAEFFNGNITDKTLSESLKYVKYGSQYVVKTQRTCKRINTISKRVLTNVEREQARLWGTSLKKDMDSNLDVIKRKYRRDGFYIDEVLERYR